MHAETKIYFQGPAFPSGSLRSSLLLYSSYKLLGISCKALSPGLNIGFHQVKVLSACLEEHALPANIISPHFAHYMRPYTYAEQLALPLLQQPAESHKKKPISLTRCLLQCCLRTLHLLYQKTKQCLLLEKASTTS